ncbi:MAG TPA: chromosomal replication initiator protein DnaA [Polyangiales bacterium]
MSDFGERTYMQEHWQSALSDMRSQLSQENFETWLAPIAWGGCDGGKLLLRIPNKFYAEWIRTHYLDLMLELLRDKSGVQKLDVAWEVDERLAEEMKKQETVRPSTPAPAPHPRAAEPARIQANLNPKYLFESFVVGPSNQLAHAASVAAASSPGARYNPLFIYGGVGLGKTHLVNAIGHRVLQDKPNARILYVSAERFTNEFIAALQNHKMDEFRNLYRNTCDVLLMDDIQFLAGRDQTMEEFFHTFNALYHSDKQIVVSSDVYPQQMKEMEERLISRFQWGMVADIQAPELDTRVAIVKKKAEQERIDLPDEVAHFLAETVQSNVRELEGTLLRLAVKAELLKKPLDLAFAREALRGSQPRRESVTTVDDIQRAVCEYFNIRMSDLKSHRRHRSVAQPRMIAMYLCRQRLNTSYTELGDRFGGKDHTTVMSAVRKIESRILSQDAEVLSSVQAIAHRLDRT